MPWSYHIDHRQKIVFTWLTGDVVPDDAQAHGRALKADPAFDPHYSQIYDLSEVRTLRFPAEKIREFASKTMFAKGARRAFVVKTDLAFGLARMFGSYREIHGDNGVSVFRARAEALAWLEAEECDESACQQSARNR